MTLLVKSVNIMGGKLLFNMSENINNQINYLNNIEIVLRTIAMSFCYSYGSHETIVGAIPITASFGSDLSWKA